MTDKPRNANQRAVQNLIGQVVRHWQKQDKKLQEFIQKERRGKNADNN